MKKTELTKTFQREYPLLEVLIDLEYEFECPKCGHKQKDTVPDICPKCKGATMWRTDIHAKALAEIRRERAL